MLMRTRGGVTVLGCVARDENAFSVVAARPNPTGFLNYIYTQEVEAAAAVHNATVDHHHCLRSGEVELTFLIATKCDGLRKHEVRLHRFDFKVREQLIPEPKHLGFDHDPVQVLVWVVLVCRRYLVRRLRSGGGL